MIMIALVVTVFFIVILDHDILFQFPFACFGPFTPDRATK